MKEMRNKKEKGITLIALIVTIVVLIILATISINAIFGENGIVKRAQNAKDLYGEGKKTESNSLDYYADYIDGYLNGNEPEVYAKLYTDGTLIFSSTNYTDSTRTVAEDYGNISKFKVEDSTTGMFEWINVSDDWSTITNKATNVIIYDKIYPTNTSCWFYNYTGTTLNLDNLDTSNVMYMERMFSGCSSLTSLDVSNFNTNKVESMYYMFQGCSSLTSLNVSHFDTSNVMYMQSMFSGCSSLTSLDVSNFNTNKVESMSYMFNSCSSLTNLDVSKFNTSNVTDMNGMFSGCNRLTNLDVSNFNTNKVESMSYMFNSCSSLTNLDVSKFNTSNVTDMNGMFSGCSRLTSLSVSNFNTDKVTIMAYMFGECSSLTTLDISNFNTENVTNPWGINGMFYNCSKLTKIYVGAKWTTENKYGNLFSGCGTSEVTLKQ